MLDIIKRLLKNKWKFGITLRVKRSVQSRPERRPERWPHVGRIRPIWRVIAAITPIRLPDPSDGDTVVIHWKFHTWMEIPSAIAGGAVKYNTIGYVTSFLDFPRSIGRIYYIMNYYPSAARVGRNPSAARRPQSVGRSPSAAIRRPERRPQSGRLCSDL